MPLLIIRLFGPLQVLVDREPWPRVRTRSAEWLLALLVLRQGSAVARSWLAGTLWPESEESQALHNLRNALLHLRKVLGSQSARLQSPTRDALRLDLEGAEVDVLRFDAALKAGDDTSLQSVVALYTGPLLEGCYEAWITQERESREQACLAALETLAERAAEQGTHAEAIRYLRQAQALDPLRDSTARRLMASLAATSDPGAAVEVYRELRNRLHEELAAAPDEETTRLFQQIRVSGKEGMRVSGVGSRMSAITQESPQVPGNSQNEAALSEIEKPTLPIGSPITRRLARSPHPLAPLIGRIEELDALQENVRQNRLVTLVGSGGVGKTRLAMAVAAQIEETFSDEVIWVELAPLSDGALILPTLAEALGLGQEVRSDSETLHAALVSRFSTTAPLLVLDNCEHLVDAVAEVVSKILPLCPSLRVLATSRQRLGVKGEVVWRVPSLPAPGAAELPADTMEASAFALTYPAVRLFVERAASARIGFALRRREEVDAACQICRRLDGIPLALELAAARTNVLSVEQIAKRLDDRFRLLTEGSRSDPPRHQTLRALIDWSYDQLSEAERTLLQRLSVFAGGGSLEAAEAVFVSASGTPQGAEDALDVLSALVNQSLIVTEEHGSGLRYRMLETVREYALDKLRERGEEPAARERHADFFLALAEEAKPFIETHNPHWLQRFDTEHDNLRAALTFFLTQEEALEKAVRLTATLAGYWSMRAHVYEERTVLVALAQRPTSPTKARVEMLGFAAQFLGSYVDYAGAERMYREMLATARKIDYLRGAAQALNGLAWILSIPPFTAPGDDLTAVRALAEESLNITRELGDKRGMTHSLFRLGNLARQQGDLEVARLYLMECRSLDRELGVKGGMAMLQLGEIALETGDCEEAKRCIQPFLIERLALGELWGIVYGLFELGKVALAERDWERATRLLGASLAQKESLNNPLKESERALYDPTRSALEEVLGEAACTRLWEQGAAMTLDEMMSFACETAD